MRNLKKNVYFIASIEKEPFAVFVNLRCIHFAYCGRKQEYPGDNKTNNNIPLSRHPIYVVSNIYFSLVLHTIPVLTFHSPRRNNNIELFLKNS